MIITPHYYALSSESQLKWTATQEKSLGREYPFADIRNETPEQYVQRTYLQFLWLPESIMSLNLLVPSMQRVNVASASQPDPPTPHPLHELLDQVLLSVRSSFNKYHVELPQILADGGGAGEMEEAMMWYALNHEKADEDDDRSRSQDPTHAEGPWVDDGWRKTWLDRLERREVQIQILLYCLKISLPGPVPPDPVDIESSPSKKRRRRKPEPKVVIPSPEERLEFFMDKMSTWQLLGTFDVDVTTQKWKGSVKDERDWMQIFCEDLVETQFRSKIPELCDLFRTKVFPDSPFSDGNSSDTQPRSSSPMQVDEDPDAVARPSLKRRRSSSITSNNSRFPSPALSNASASHKTGADTSLARSRSRSLSVSLAQDADSRRAGSVGATKKPVLNREVSMSRVFKEKPVRKEDDVKRGDLKKAKTISKTMLSILKPPKAQVDGGVTLVAATPVKGSKKTQQLLSFGLPKSARAPLSPTPGGIDEEEEDWSLLSSPDVLLLGAGDEDDNVFDPAGKILAADTPVKKGRGTRLYK